MPTSKNYHVPGGEKWVVEGALEIKEGATVTGLTATTAAASADALGGIKAAAKGAGDTVECKIDSATSKLFVPTYPTVPEIPVADNQAASVATTTEELVTDFNALLAALKTAGLMAADPEGGE